MPCANCRERGPTLWYLQDLAEMCAVSYNTKTVIWDEFRQARRDAIAHGLITPKQFSELKILKTMDVQDRKLTPRQIKAKRKKELEKRQKQYELGFQTLLLPLPSIEKLFTLEDPFAGEDFDGGTVTANGFMA